MNKELKDYLHLYLGCDVLISVNGMVNKVVSIVRNPDAEIILGTAILLGVKPILRPLSDMTDIEATDVAEIAIGNKDFITTYKGMGYEEDGHEIHKTVKCYKIETYCDIPTINAWIPSALLQIDHECNDVIVSRFENLGKVCRDDMIDNPFELTRYLLSKHFDLFGLIESELAIDKNKITNHDR